MRSTSALVVVVALLAAISNNTATARTWTDKKGKEIEAELVEVKAGAAVLKLESGKIAKVPLARLSAEDQQFIKDSADSPDLPTEEEMTPPAKPKSKKPATKSGTKQPPTTKSEKSEPAEPAAQAPAAGNQNRSAVTASGVTVEVVGITIGKPLPADPEADPKSFGPTLVQGQPGTRLLLSLADPERQIVRVDQDKSKIIACTDDVGGKLNDAPASGGAAGGFAGFSQFQTQLRPSKHFGLTEITLPVAPTAGAAKIHLQGTVVVECGTGEKTADQAGVSLTAAGEITAGPVPLKIAPADKQSGFPLGGFSFPEAGFSPANSARPAEPKVFVTIKTEKPVEIIKQIVFLNGAGKEIPQQDLGSSTFTFNGSIKHERTIGLAEAVDKATVRIVSYEKLEPISVPFDFLVGVGF